MPSAVQATRPTLLVALTLAVLSIVLWGPAVFNTGRYYDDWALIAAMDDAASGAPADIYDACRGQIGGGRPVGCAYHAGVYRLTLGGRVRAHHALSLAFVGTTALLLYLLLTQARFPRGPALAVAALWIVFPGSDSTRLWATAVGGQFVLGMYFVAVLVGIAALRRTGWRAGVLHALSVFLYLGLVFSYEIVVPLIAVAGVFYGLAAPGRSAFVRGAVDLALAAAFAIYRTTLSPVGPDAGFVVKRTAGETAARVGDIAEGAWQTWQDLFMPGPAGALLIACVAMVVVGTLVVRPESRKAIARWLLLVLVAAVAVAVAVAAYVPANDLYLPQAEGLFNRLNLAAAPAYCLAFVALLGALHVALRHAASAAVATAVVAALFGAVVAWQLEEGTRSQNAYEESWRVQTAAAYQLGIAAKRLPADATVVSFGHPIWERGYVPVFSASWDLRGMLDYHTEVDPLKASPFLSVMSCERDGLHADGRLWAAYRGGAELWFLHAVTAEARRIPSLRECQAAVVAWGVPPLFGRTVTEDL